MIVELTKRRGSSTASCARPRSGAWLLSIGMRGGMEKAAWSQPRCPLTFANAEHAIVYYSGCMRCDAADRRQSLREFASQEEEASLLPVPKAAPGLAAGGEGRNSLCFLRKAGQGISAPWAPPRRRNCLAQGPPSRPNNSRASDGISFCFTVGHGEASFLVANRLRKRPPR